MFEKVLIATDLSLASESIVNCGEAFKQLGAEKAILCHALGLKHLEDLKYQLLPLVEPRLKKQRDILEQSGLKTEIIIAPGIPSIEIHRISEEKDISLIIIGSHGESLASHVFFKFGGVASEVLHSHKKPLLLVRTEVIKENEREVCVQVSCSDFREKVLFATDFSDNSHRAFLYVEEIVKRGCKDVTLIHVQDKARIERHLEHKLEEFNKIDIERLEMLKKALLEKGAEKISIKIPYGNPTGEILSQLNKKEYSLAVMGSQGRGYIKELFLGSVSHNIVRNAPTSVLLIPALRQ
jgi:nucleotide-binding universal stress UspA family protein